MANLPAPKVVAAADDSTTPVSVSQKWGFNAEDSTENLQAAFDSGVSPILIDVPLVDGKPQPWITRTLFLKSDTVVYFAPGVEILAKKGSFLGRADPLLKISLCKNVTLKALEPRKSTLRMRKTDYHQPPYTRAEWRHGISILSSDNIVVDGLNIIDSGGDGVYLGVSQRGVTNSNVTIKNVVCDGNNRQGISVISAKNLLIEDTVLRNTWGTAPQSGIDFEPNGPSEELTNCVMRNCVCEDNAGAGIDLYLPNLDKQSGPVGITIENCICRNNKRSSVAMTVSNKDQESLTGEVLLLNCKFENNPGAVYVRSLAENASSLKIENCEIINCSRAAEIDSKTGKVTRVEVTPIHFQARHSDDLPFGTVVMKNITIRDENCTGLDGSFPFFKYIDGSINGFGLTSIDADIKFISGGKTEQFKLDNAWAQKTYPTVNIRKVPRRIIEPSEVKQLAKIESTGQPQNLPTPHIFCRNHAEYWLFANKDQEVQFNLIERPVGGSGFAPGKPVIIDPQGKKRTLEPLQAFGQVQEYTFKAAATGVYRILIEVGSHAVTMTASNCPVVLNSQPYLGLVYTSGSVWFYVPEGTKEFAVKVFGSGAERVKVSLFAPATSVSDSEKTASDQQPVWTMDNIEKTEMFFTEIGKPVPAGLWRIQFARPSIGVLEDFGVAIMGIPSLLGADPNLMLGN